MRVVFGLVLVVGLGLAGFAVYMAKGQFGRYEAALARERAALSQMVETTEVFVLNRQVTYGERLTSEDIRAVRWPVEAIPEGAFTSIEELFPETGPAFRSVTRTLEKDEAVIAVKVTEPGLEAGIQSRLRPGMNAVTIRVNATTGVSGFLRPGDRVNVFWTGDSLGREITKLIHSGVEIIAIDQSANDDLAGAVVARTITVQGTLEESLKLTQAQSTGRLSLALVRVDAEVAEAGTIEIDQNALLGIEQQQVIERQEAQVCTTRTRRGTEVIEIPIPCPESN